MKLLRSLTASDLKDKQVLLRVDFNVPLFRSSSSKMKTVQIADDFRLKAHKDTIDYLLDNGARVALLAHISDIDSFKPIIDQISGVIGHEIHFVSDCVGKIVGKALDKHNLVLLENVRQHKGEMNNDDDFAKELVSGFDLYVNDAFSVSHRDHASLTGVTKYLPSYAGMVIELETKSLQNAIDAPQAGKTLILGGAKISTKLPVIRNFADRAEDILIGGALVNNFLKYNGYEVGKSIVDKQNLHLIGELKDAVLNLPRDLITSMSADGKNQTNINNINEIDKNCSIFDIGPETAEHYSEIIGRSKMVIWNGPMGLAEVDAFAEGTKKIAEAVIKCHNAYIGGGDTIAEVDELGMLDKMAHVSTGGGAMLMFLSAQRMPGLDVLGYYNS